MIRPSDVHMLPTNVRSAASVRNYVGFDELAAKHPGHELFIIWNTQVPGSPFAVVMRIPKAKVSTVGWPLIIDQESRILEMRAPVPD